MKKLFPSSNFSHSNLSKHLKLVFIGITISAFLVTGCKKDIQSGQPLPAESESLSTLPIETSDALNFKLGKVRVVTSSAEMERGKPIYIDLFQLDHQYKEMVLRSLKLSQAACDDNTDLNQWLDRQLIGWNNTVITNALNTAMLDLPAINALVFENRTFGQYFGQRGEYTFRLAFTFIKLKHFWDIESRNIVLAAMHGSMLRNRFKLYSTYQIGYGLDPEDATYFTDVVSKLLKVYPQYRNGNHPIFTFNAFSQPSIIVPPLGVLPPKIVMGDGIIEGYSAIGYGDVAPQAILAHEYGHQVQFQLGIFSDNTPESTRRVELMADAFSAYYLSHIRGEFMRWKRVKQFLQVFFNIGDCDATSPGHHGTPNQRMAAAEWGYELAKNAHRQGRVLPGKVFASRFDAALSQILAH